MVKRQAWWLAIGLLGCGDSSTASPLDSGTHMDAAHDARSEMDAAFDADAHVDAAHDARTEPATWLATKTTLDVWWPGLRTTDPGRGAVELYTLVQAHGACPDHATIQLCGLRVPVTTNGYCEAQALGIADDVWDLPSMPRFDVRAPRVTDRDAGMSILLAALFLGVDLSPEAEQAPWPDSDRTTPWIEHIHCAAGDGAACITDPDGDGLHGISATYRNDRATYTLPVDDGLCFEHGAYEYASAGTFDVGLGACDCGSDPRVTTVGLALRVGSHLVTDDACTDATRIDPRTLDVRALDCTIDPSTLVLLDPRLDTTDDACTSVEVAFVEANMPRYRVLASGEQPGDARPSRTWEERGRDIDRTPSEGTRSQSIVLNLDDIDAGEDGAPSCAQVRAAFAD